jgi:hypothetical protein
VVSGCIYVEGISARTFNQDLKPLAIDRNYLDLLNLFFDLKVFEEAGGALVCSRCTTCAGSAVAT